MDLDDNRLYINRELSWLDFNKRVLEEAFDKTNPLIERLKFLAITASNLDEFFMVRVAALKEQLEAGYNKPDPAGMTPEKQLDEISKEVHKLVKKQYSCLTKSILPALNKEGLFFVDFNDLNDEQKDYLYQRFTEIIFPVLTPMAIDKSRPFPLLANKSLNLAVKLKGTEECFAVVQVPSVLPRIMELPSNENGRLFIFLEDIIIAYIDTLFAGYSVKSVLPFCIIRNSDLDIDEEDTEDLLKEIERSVANRKWGSPVRLELIKDSDKDLREFLVEMLDIIEEEIYEVTGYLDLTVWMNFSSVDGLENLKHQPLVPQNPPFFQEKADMFAVIRESDQLVHHPYESFDCVVEFIRQASEDPGVLAIKQTLYRVSGNSPIIQALIRAAGNGKQVTVLVELKARFEEAKNINWARTLERAGCHVIYGLVGLKIHCKAALVVRREEEGIRRYVHLSTGNYNDQTAKLYTDIGMFTARESFASDISALFNYLTGYTRIPTLKKIQVSPISLRQFLAKMIDNEIDMVQQGKEGRIIAKMNSLVDQDIIKLLYQASQAGVKIDLIIRGICCLRSGQAGLSENIRVISIVGRLLEHSRIFYFQNGGDSKIYLSSADWMPRNLDRRVEITFPIEQEDLKKRIIKILSITLSDTVKARLQKKDGRYFHLDRRGKERIESQLIFYEKAKAKSNK
ncbi:MAG: Polyphosphate kinase [Candidatus Dichloromethanomonas elyunquensis]|nr:MAG: Polyphosphate kinase [Candidatus Dichloromethanomonas elyunquensis]